MAASDFRALETRNRRQTLVLVAVFVVLYAILGLGLDFVAGDIRIVNGNIFAFPIFTILAIILAAIQSFASFYSGSSLVLASVHARPLTPDTPKHQMVLDVVDEMATAARMPVPKAYVMGDPSPNAFATGRDPTHSVICVTQGLVDEMDREEMQGVIGHEMSHIADYDIRTMMMVAILAGGIAMLSDFAYRWMFWGGFGVTGGGGNSDNSSDNEAGLLIAIAVFILAAVAPVFAQMIAMAVSREREYLADASSVQFTRNPRALLRALQRIAQTESPLKAGTAGTAHLFMVNPREGLREGDQDGFFDRMFSTHPPLNQRIARLQAMLGESGPAPAMSAGNATN